MTTEAWTYTVDTIDTTVIISLTNPNDNSGIKFNVFTNDENKSKAYKMKIKAEIATKEFVEMEYTVYVQKIIVPYDPAARAIEKIYHVNEVENVLELEPYILTPMPVGVFRYQILQSDGSGVVKPFSVVDVKAGTQDARIQLKWYTNTDADVKVYSFKVKAIHDQYPPEV